MSAKSLLGTGCFPKLWETLGAGERNAACVKGWAPNLQGRQRLDAGRESERAMAMLEAPTRLASELI